MNPKNKLKKVTGIEWGKLAALIEEKKKFHDFDFSTSEFGCLKTDYPQLLVEDEGKLKWDSEETEIESWEKLLIRSYAQLRNNIAHGNKAHLPSQFTQGRTKEFMEAGRALREFIAGDIFEKPNWKEPIQFN